MFVSSTEFEHVSEIGHGTYGCADLVRHVATGCEYVRKRVRTDHDLDESDSNQLAESRNESATTHPSNASDDSDESYEDCGYTPVVLREISALVSLQHENILALECVSLDKPGQPELYTKKYEQDLASWLEQKRHHGSKHIHMSVIQHIMRQLISGLNYLHNRCYIHRDLKPGNIFLNTDPCTVDEKNEVGVVVIGDLGLSRFVAAPVETGQCLTPTVQSLGYRSIELLLGRNIEYDGAIDIFSLGCILMELLCGGQRLFVARTEIECIFQIFQLMGTPCDESWPGISVQMAHFQRSIFPTWKRVPFRKQDRFRAQLEFYGPEVLDLAESCLELDPAKRISAAELAVHPFLSCSTHNRGSVHRNSPIRKKQRVA